ncbi:MAG: 4Fe-4S dicluster domain-containing protein [Chromatiales bacterium]|nr:4Fe-4S dicluster domain-containing protein [Chromatiales bacterium]
MSKPTSNDAPDFARRAFVAKATTAAGAAVVAPGLVVTAFAKPADQPVSAKTRWGMLIDAAKCAADCTACVDSCGDQHGWRDESVGRPEQHAQWIRKVGLRDTATGHVTSVPVMCQHCETAPCADVCPTGASYRRPDGIVLVNMHTCIGCRYCMMACPYKARSFVHQTLTDQLPDTPRGKGCVESCNLCATLIDESSGTAPQTACSAACQKDGNGAIVFGDLNDPNSEISQRLKKEPSEQLRADLGLNTGVRYQHV